MYETTDDYGMEMSLSKYLMAQGEITFEDAMPEIDCVLDDPYAWTQLVKETDRLGWDCFLEGKVSQQWILTTTHERSEERRA